MSRGRSAVLLGVTLLLIGYGDIATGVAHAPRATDTVVAQPLPAGPDSKLVFAHYYPPNPISIENASSDTDYYATQFLPPGGEGGKHAAYGGLMRDRPLPHPPQPSDNWRVLDLQDEIRQAQTVGIDGFSVDIITPAVSPEWISQVPSALLRAAVELGTSFKIMLMPDISGPLAALSPAALSDEMAALAASPAAYRLHDGRLVIAPFLAEAHPASWWSQFLDQMRARHGIAVALVPLFLDEADNAAAFAPISYGMSMWGGRNPQFNPTSGYSLDRITDVHNRNNIWMQPISVQDYRPDQGVYDEAENTTNLRDTWQIAISGHSDWAQLITWNDYSEGTAFAPSVHHGWAFLRICDYYIKWFKNGVPPPITADQLVLTHRTQRVDAISQYPETSPMLPRQNGSPPRDTVEVLSFLATPGTVTIHVGAKSFSCAVPAGVQACTTDLGQPPPQGMTVSATLSRGNAKTLTVVSPFPVVASPYVQDMQYTATVS
jgi:hypothetical protein